MAGDSSPTTTGANSARPPTPQGEYVAAKQFGEFAMSAGMTPRVDGTLIVTGIVGASVSIAQASHAAGIATENALAALSAEIGGEDRIADCLHMTVYVACEPDFTAHSQVADGASVAIMHRLGAGFLPSRAAIGVSSLPGGSPVEVELTVAVRD